MLGPEYVSFHTSTVSCGLPRSDLRLDLVAEHSFDRSVSTGQNSEVPDCSSKTDNEGVAVVQVLSSLSDMRKDCLGYYLQVNLIARLCRKPISVS